MDTTTTAEADDDALVEIPLISGCDLVKKSTLSNADIRGMVVRCTSCLHQINHHDSAKIKRHFRLKVVVCTDCYQFYGESEFSQDESGNYNYCTWCGNGGKLYICDFCPHTFCNNCVRRNFGRAEVGNMSKNGWRCYMCIPDKLKTKVAYCDMILEYSKMATERKDRKLAKMEVCDENKVVSHEWMATAFDRCDETAKTFLRKVQKLRDIEVTRSKSIKHIIKKLEEIVASHKSDMKAVVTTMSKQYQSYLQMQKDAEVKKVTTESSDGNWKPPRKASLCDEEKDTESDPDGKKKTSNGDVNGSTVSINNQAKLSLLCSDSDDNKPSVDANTKAKLSLLASDSSEDEIGVTPNISSQKVNGEVVEEPIVADSPPDVLSTTIPIVKDATETKVTPLKKETTAKKELLFSSSSDLESTDDNQTPKKKPDNPPKPKVSRKKLSELSQPIKNISGYNDPKLNMKVVVEIEKCDRLLEKGKQTITLSAEYQLEELDREILKLTQIPKLTKRAKKSKTSEAVMKTPKAISKKEEENKASSSSISFSSSGEDCETVNLFKDGDAASKAKLPKVKTDSSSEDIDDPLCSSPEPGKDKKKKSKVGGKQQKKDSDNSSDDFQPLKKRKYDKLLNKRFLSDEEDSKGSGKNSEKEAKKGEEKNKKKRKLLDGEKGSNSSVETTSSDSDEDKKKKKRKRIKKPAVSSSENGSGDENKDLKGSQGTPGKHRKNIKKIISKKDLTIETKEAQQIEKDRRKRVTDRQKLYNIITDKSVDGLETVTKKLVLEVDPESKEEVVEIHPDLIDKLKPHQVSGVKFMWECTIESIQELEKGGGSGCILAHCMGLGKTLQVICFLHTCLCNKRVSKTIRKAMVICPYNTILNWAKEFEKWLENVDDEILVHQLNLGKSNLEKLDILKYWHRDGGVLIVNYETFRRLCGPKVPKLKVKEREKLRKYLIDPGADIVICDEGHMLKNENTGVSKACSELDTRRRIVLTGTPLQNNLKEYHCMLSFVKPHLLGTSKEFRNRFVNPIMNGQYEDSNEHDVRRMKKRIHILHKLLEGCVQRCDYSALTKFLPTKHEFVIAVKLSETQIKMYRWYLDNRSTFNKEKKTSGATLFKDYNTLMNLCLHPFVVHTSFQRAEKRRILQEDDEEDESFINDASEESSAKATGDESEEEVVRKYKTRSRESDVSDAESEISVEHKEWYHEFISDEDKHNILISGKMVLLVDILKECEAIGDKLIVFSQSLLTLDCVEDILEFLNDLEVSEEDKARDITNEWVKGIDYYRMDGGTSAEDRKHFIDRFNSPTNDRARLFLVSTKAGGLGTNLVGANRVVMLDCSWNPSHDVQAIFRVYRFGQHKPVYIYRLLAHGTMEEKIYERQVTKLSLSIRVVDEQQIDRHFNAAELAELYMFTPEAQSSRPTPMVPNDRILAEMLIKNKDWLVNYHEHDSLLQNQTEEDLTEEERKAAWEEYENEREGKAVETDFDGIQTYVKEPDFDQADYEGTLIDIRGAIPSFINELKKRFPHASVVELRQKLLACINTFRNKIQEKHVQTLRIKQEFLSKGSVPASVNKYILELTQAFQEVSKHLEAMKQLVAKDTREAQERYIASLRAQQNAQPAGGMNFQGQQFMTGNFPSNLNANVNYEQMRQRLTNMYNNTYVPRPAHMNMPFASAQHKQGTVPGARNVGPSVPKQTFAKPPMAQPVITEVTEESSSASADSKYTSNPTSTVIIEEID